MFSTPNVFTTSNNVKIHTLINPALHGFYLCLYIKAGTLYESGESNGISHFWEHMLFRSINNKLDGNLYRMLDSIGATVDAATYREMIQLKICGASESFRQCADILTTVFSPFYASAAETNIERRRIKSEIRESDESTSLDLFTRRIVWENTPLENPIIGRRSVLDKIGTKALADVQKKLLTPENIYFCLTGAVSDEDIAYLCRLVEAYPLEHGAPRTNIAPIPTSFGKRNCRIEVKNSDSNIVRFNFDAITANCTVAEIYLLYDILFSGERALIFKALSEDTGLIYSYDACFERYNNIGNLYFSFEVASGKIAEAVERTVKVLSDLSAVPYDDLDCTRAAYVINSGLLFDDPDDLNWQMGAEYALTSRHFGGIEARREEFVAVTPERISELASRIFRTDNLVLTLKTKKRSFDDKSIRKLLNQLDI